MSGRESLGTAPLEPIGLDDHVRGPGGAPEAILYLDLACPSCAASWVALRTMPIRLCVRHFPLASKRPRSPALHAATEAAHALGGEDAFWGMWDSLMADQAHQDDPHLWSRAKALDLDLDDFEATRRSASIAARVRAGLLGGIRAGVTGTPAGFLDQVEIRGRLDECLGGLVSPGGLPADSGHG